MENVLVVYICHLCQKEVSNSRNLRDHILRIHTGNIEKSVVLTTFHSNKFISKKFINNNPEVKYSRRVECSGCHELFGCIKELGTHFFNHILRKRPIEEGTSSNSNSNNCTNKKISLNKGKQVHTFDFQLISNINIQNGPKFTMEDMKSLSPMYSFRFQGSCYPINNDADTVIANNQQGSTATLPVTASDQERCLLRTIRYTLQDFVSKYRRKSPIIPSNHERTFFFDRVMPIINYFADNSGTVHFEWGEKMIMSLQAVTLSVAFVAKVGLKRIVLQKKKSTAFSEISNPNYADGIEYLTTTGVVDEERIVVECSSGGHEENIQHTYDDSLRLTKSLTAMLVLKAYKRPNASYKPFCKLKTIGIQCIKRTLTLFIYYSWMKKRSWWLKKREVQMYRFVSMKYLTLCKFLN
ncbi:uncharacterized protein EV154DRAFT_486438 [Mucor mucedo]|uniref:uncharacterized protein n=1 Tax=Mucor mucedo TaxID=29922 RepID=UPI00221F4CBA|nr:uncharacterized protein EV154DRAFT_486438 [Mucor mucedo]KAI7876626.1 hypothetical protein EV154DRAFT_486438 [Mucor mucedo]